MSPSPVRELRGTNCVGHELRDTNFNEETRSHPGWLVVDCYEVAMAKGYSMHYVAPSWLRGASYMAPARTRRTSSTTKLVRSTSPVASIIRSCPPHARQSEYGSPRLSRSRRNDNQRAVRMYYAEGTIGSCFVTRVSKSGLGSKSGWGRVWS
jgi:hypothetical protein